MYNHTSICYLSYLSSPHTLHGTRLHIEDMIHHKKLLNKMAIPDKPKKYGGVLLVILLVGTSGVYAKTNMAPSASIPGLVSRPLALSVPATELNQTSRATTSIPRGGGDVAIGFAARLKVGSYFAIWYILNIIYNSKYV